MDMLVESGRGRVRGVHHRQVVIEHPGLRVREMGEGSVQGLQLAVGCRHSRTGHSSGGGRSYGGSRTLRALFGSAGLVGLSRIEVIGIGIGLLTVARAGGTGGGNLRICDVVFIRKYLHT